MKDLRTLRESKQWTQKDLAVNAGVTEITVCNIEKQNTAPQNQVRHNVEQSLRTRVDWLKTCGIAGGNIQSWEDVEASLRKTVINANNLSATEKEQFIAVAQEYIQTFASHLHMADDEDVLLPTNPY